MTKHLPENIGFSAQEQAYIEKYKGETIIIKLSGGEINSERFGILTRDLIDLSRVGIKFILIFGGGDQIKSRCPWRKQIDGVSVTDERLIREGVIPAFAEIRDKFKKVFSDIPHHFIDPEQMECELADEKEFGLVGTPIRINDLNPDSPLNILGFWGKKNGIDINVNADTIALPVIQSFAEETGKQIDEVIFMTGSAGIVDKDGKVVSLLSMGSLESIEAGQYPGISLVGGMLKKGREVLTLLPVTKKVVITSTGNLRKELLTWNGGGQGTMCADLSAQTWDHVSPSEEAIFHAIINDEVKARNFRRRPHHEVMESIPHHHFIRVKKSILGGIAALPREDGWLELIHYLSGYNGIGQMVLAHTKEDAARQGKRMFAVTKSSKAKASFKKAGFAVAARFKKSGEIIVEKGHEVPPSVLNYPEPHPEKEIFVFPSPTS